MPKIAFKRQAHDPKRIPIVKNVGEFQEHAGAMPGFLETILALKHRLAESHA